jgi:molecular chaperone DnaJ
MDKRDYYEILGISKSSDKKEIKKAYRELAKKYHPDKNTDGDAEHKFKEVQEAYDVLMDDEKRKAYDQFGHAGTQGFGGFGGFGGQGGYSQYGGFEDLNDIFSQFFGQGFGGFSSSSRGGQRRRGSDIEVTMEIPFRDAVFGIKEDIKYKRKVPCEDCNSTGAKNGNSFKTCVNCGGRGAVTRIQNTFLGRIQTQATCEVCYGLGEMIDEQCPTCHGQGYTEKTDTFTIKIPNGIPNGVTIKFAQKGNASGQGGTTGDLYVNIEVTPDEEFERIENDIYSSIEISPSMAVLGATIDVNTVHGVVKLKIPSGTQPGKIFKMSGKGGPKFRGNGNGDHYVKTIVKIPEKVFGEEKSLWEKLGSAN